MNRRQRRTQAASPQNVKSVDDIPLARPDRKKGSSNTKTLYELAAERQAALMPQTKAFAASPTPDNVVTVKIGPDGKITRMDENDGLDEQREHFAENEVVPPVIDTLFLATSLSALHFTLEVLTVHQYAQELLFLPIVKHTIFVAFPTLCLLIHLFRGHLFPDSIQNFSPRLQRVASVLRQTIFVIIANYTGCYLIQLTNDGGYYAVMKNAPSLGTVWIWAIIELGLIGALAGVIGPGIYAWYWGYGVI